MDSLFIHCGLHKTATTLIQRKLGEIHPTLLEHGLYIPICDRPENFWGSPHNIAWELIGFRRFDPTGFNLDMLQKALSNQSGDAFISSEHYAGAFKPFSRIEPLFDISQNTGRQPKIILYLRNQASLFISLFLELQNHGYHTDISMAVDEVLSTGSLRYQEWVFWFDYDKILTGLEHRGVELFLRNYHAMHPKGPVADILELMGYADVPLQEINGERKMNTARLDGRLDRYLERRLNLGDPAARLFLREFCSGFNLVGRLRADVLKRFQDRFADGNARLQERWGIDLSIGEPQPANTGDVSLDLGFSFETQRLVHLELLDRFGWPAFQRFDMPWQASILLKARKWLHRQGLRQISAKDRKEADALRHRLEESWVQAG